jgi:hypothetical protein
MSYATSIGRRAGPFGWIIAAVSGFGARAARAAARPPALSDLSDAQLKDIGVERSSIQPPRATIEVDGALMRRLMSLR